MSPHQGIGMDDDDAHDKNSRNQTMSPQQRREMSEFDAYKTKVTASNDSSGTSLFGTGIEDEDVESVDPKGDKAHVIDTQHSNEK